MKYSIIVPVFNRPDEVDELLESLTRQTCKDFEVIVVEDGSQINCKDVCDKYANILDLHYYAKPNSGPGQSRNYGAERANGEWLIVLDSDVVLPDGYLQAVENELREMPRGEYVLLKTFCRSARTRMPLFTDWGITLEEKYHIHERPIRDIEYMDVHELSLTIPLLVCYNVG